MGSRAASRPQRKVGRSSTKAKLLKLIEDIENEILPFTGSSEDKIVQAMRQIITEELED